MWVSNSNQESKHVFKYRRQETTKAEVVPETRLNISFPIKESRFQIDGIAYPGLLVKLR